MAPERAALLPGLPYKHEPLATNAQQIRLFRLVSINTLKGFGTQGIRIPGQLQTFDLNQCPSFQALSYVWGNANPEQRYTVHLDGFELEVRRNLFDFLELYGSLTKSRFDRIFPTHAHTDKSPYTSWLWIDQICIDESNGKERGHQVQLMKKIYKEAAQVIVWLGRDDKDTANVLADLRKQRSSLGMKIIGSRLEQNHKHSGRRADILAKNEYWSRLWVAQEFCLARTLTLLCCREYDDVRECFGWQSREPEYQINAVNLISLRVERNLEGLRHREAPFILKTFATSKCHDPRDVVYGVLGLWHDKHQTWITVDYNKSVEDVFNDAIRILVKWYVKRHAVVWGKHADEHIDVEGIYRLWHVLYHRTGVKILPDEPTEREIAIAG